MSAPRHKTGISPNFLVSVFHFVLPSLVVSIRLNIVDPFDGDFPRRSVGGWGLGWVSGTPVTSLQPGHPRPFPLS